MKGTSLGVETTRASTDLPHHKTLADCAPVAALSESEPNDTKGTADYVDLDVPINGTCNTEADVLGLNLTAGRVIAVRYNISSPAHLVVWNPSGAKVLDGTFYGWD